MLTSANKGKAGKQINAFFFTVVPLIYCALHGEVQQSPSQAREEQKFAAQALLCSELKKRCRW
jgi:hypothetical protein